MTYEQQQVQPVHRRHHPGLEPHHHGAWPGGASSAEVIVEAPCCTGSGGILPLTDFGTVSLTGSMANGAAMGNAGGLTQIIMIDNEGRDKDTFSSLSGGENFSATWVRSS